MISYVVQVFVSIIFMFISLLAPAIAFGGIMEEVTGNLIGETETLVATGICGVVYGLFAVQPLTILAFTGPVLLMEETVFEVGYESHTHTHTHIPHPSQPSSLPPPSFTPLSFSPFSHHSFHKTTVFPTSNGVHVLHSG